MKKLILFLFAISMFACENSPKTVKEESPKTVKEPAPEFPEAPPEPEVIKNDDTSFDAEKTFAAYIAGANSIEVARVGNVDKSVTYKISGDLMEDIIGAVGSDTKAAQVVPKCLGTYRMKFMKGATELISFNSICSTETAVLSTGKFSLFAADTKALVALLKQITDSPMEPVKLQKRCCRAVMMNGKSP